MSAPAPKNGVVRLVAELNTEQMSLPVNGQAPVTKPKDAAYPTLGPDQAQAF